MKVIGHKKNQETNDYLIPTTYDQVTKTERSEESHDDRMSDRQNQSQEGDEVRKQFGKEDRQIVNNPTLNIKYKLVERPRFLLSFTQKEQEQEFQQFISKYFFNETIWFLIIKTCIDAVQFFAIGWRSDAAIIFLQFAWVIPYIAFSGIMIRVIAVTILSKPNVVA